MKSLKYKNSRFQGEFDLRVKPHKDEYSTIVTVLDVGRGTSEKLVGDPFVTMPVGGCDKDGEKLNGYPVPIGGVYYEGDRELDEGSVATVAVDTRGYLCVTANGEALPVSGDVVVSQAVDVNPHDVTNDGVFCVQESGEALRCLSRIAQAVEYTPFEFNDDGAASVVVENVVAVDGSSTVQPVCSDALDSLSTIVDGGVANVHLVSDESGSASEMTLRDMLSVLVDIGNDVHNLNPVEVTKNGHALVHIDEVQTVHPHDVTNAGVFEVQVTGAGLELMAKSASQTVLQNTIHRQGVPGVVLLCVRNDELGSLAQADGGYSVLQVGKEGALYTETVASVLPDGAATVHQQQLSNRMLEEVARAVRISSDAVSGERRVQVDVVTEPNLRHEDDSVTSLQRGDSVSIGGQEVAVRYKNFEAYTERNVTVTVVESVGKRIKVLGYVLSGKARWVKFQGGTSAMSLDGSLVAPVSLYGWFQCDRHADLVFEVENGSCGGHVVYIEI